MAEPRGPPTPLCHHVFSGSHRTLHRYDHRRCARVYSTITTASAPLGTGAPVMISTLRPVEQRDALSRRRSCFDLPDATQLRRNGLQVCGPNRESVASRSGKGGKSRSARKSSASTRPAGLQQRYHFGLGGRKRQRHILRRARRASLNERSLDSAALAIAQAANRDSTQTDQGS